MLHRRLPGRARVLIIALLLVGTAFLLRSFPLSYEPYNEISAEPASATASPKPSSSPTPVPEPTPKPFVIPEVHPYSDAVSKGSIRYVSQLNNVSDNGWGKYAWKAGNECTTACISMAMSYLGIDASPEAILSFSSRTVLSSSYGMEDKVIPSALTKTAIAKEDRFSVFSQMFDLYTAPGEIHVSPVLIYLQGFGHYHAIIIIGKDSEGYLCVDPTPEGVHHVTISENGTITTDEEGYLRRYLSSGSPASIHSLAQWQLTDPPMDEQTPEPASEESLASSDSGAS